MFESFKSKNYASLAKLNNKLYQTFMSTTTTTTTTTTSNLNKLSDDLEDYVLIQTPAEALAELENRYNSSLIAHNNNNNNNSTINNKSSSCAVAPTTSSSSNKISSNAKNSTTLSTELLTEELYIALNDTSQDADSISLNRIRLDVVNSISSIIYDLSSTEVNLNIH